MSAPDTTGSASRLSAPYLVSGICCARRKVIVASIARMPHDCVIHRGSVRSTPTSSANPIAPTARAYRVRNVRTLFAVDPAPQRRRERNDRLDALVRGAHDGAPHDDAVGDFGDFARLLRT